MARNNSVELLGHLGADPKSYDKNGKVFIVLNLATSDSYAIEENGETKWKERDPVWHDVLVFALPPPIIPVNSKRRPCTHFR